MTPEKAISNVRAFRTGGGTFGHSDHRHARIGERITFTWLADQQRASRIGLEIREMVRKSRDKKYRGTVHSGGETDATYRGGAVQPVDGCQRSIAGGAYKSLSETPGRSIDGLQNILLFLCHYFSLRVTLQESLAEGSAAQARRLALPYALVEFKYAKGASVDDKPDPGRWFRAKQI
jgi:hypothetical protein